MDEKGKIRTPMDRQKSIVNFYSEALKVRGVKVIKASRMGYHLRFFYEDDAEKLLSSIHPCTFHRSEHSLSGTFVTDVASISGELPEILTIKKKLGIAKTGDSIYFVNTGGGEGKSFSRGDFTPNYFGMAGKTYTARSLLDESKLQVGKVEDKWVRDFMNLLLDKVGGGSSLSFSYSGHENISDKNYKLVMNNFSEILGAIYAANQLPVKGVHFPKSLINQLSDFDIIPKGSTSSSGSIPVSVKYQTGSASSIVSTESALKKKKYKDVKLESAREVILVIIEKSTIDGILFASHALKLPGYQVLQKQYNLHFDQVSVIRIEQELDKINGIQQFTREYKEFHQKMGKSASPNTTREIFTSNRPRKGLILSPMGYGLVDALNADPIYSFVLNDVISGMNAKFLRVEMNHTGPNFSVTFELQDFKDLQNNYAFSYNANANNPSLKKIAFSVKK